MCAKTDLYCNVLCGGFDNSEIRLWDIGQSYVKRKVNRNISEIELACCIPPEPETPLDNVLYVVGLLNFLNCNRATKLPFVCQCLHVHWH